MTQHYGNAKLTVDGEEIGELENVELNTENLSEKEVYGLERDTCDHCGKEIHPADMVITWSTDGDKSGVYHTDCRP